MKLDNLHAQAPALLLEYRKQLIIKDKVASRHTYNSTYTLSLDSGIELRGDITNRYIIQGRRAGAKMPPNTAQFRQWLLIRNIPATANFVIRRAIGRNGIRPTDLLTPTINIMKPRLESAISIDVLLHYGTVANTIINQNR